MNKDVGKYIVIEGHDGTGKSTQVELLAKRLKEEKGIKSVTIHEPSGTPIADRLREIIKNGELKRDPTTNLLLFTAARRELYRQVIAPALENGEWVLAARNWISTVAYQGHGEGLDPNIIEEITHLYTDDAYMHPDYTMLLALNDETERNRRITSRGELENPDTFESMGDDFQKNVKEGYLSVAAKYDYPIIEAGQSIEDVQLDVWNILF